MSASDTKVINNTPLDRYIASSGQTDFDYNFLIYDREDLTVLKTTNVGTDSQNTEKLSNGINQDYTINNTGNKDGGKIVLTSGANDGEIYTLFRNSIIDRKTDLNQDGDFSAEALNLEFDEIFLIAQELQFQLNRTPTLAEQTQLDSVELPEPDAGKTLAWNQEEDNITNIDVEKQQEERIQDITNDLIVAGNNVTKNYDDSNDKLTINATQLSEEQVDDYVGNLISGGTNVTANYDDSNDNLSIGLTNTSVTVAGNSVSLGGSTTVAHGDLSDAPTSAHHAKYTDSEAISAAETGLDMNGEIRATHDYNYALMAEPNNIDNDGGAKDSPELELRAKHDSDTSGSIVSEVTAYEIQFMSSVNSGNQTGYVRHGVGINTEAITIDTNNNVGINTNSQTETLDVNGTLGLTGALTQTGDAITNVLEPTDVTTDGGAKNSPTFTLRAKHDSDDTSSVSSTSTDYTIEFISDIGSFSPSQIGEIKHSVAGNTNQLVLDTNGRVGIGKTTSASYKLTIDGKLDAKGLDSSEVINSSGFKLFSGNSYEDSSGNPMLTDVVATGSTTLSSGTATVDTGVAHTNTATFNVAIAPDTTDADVAADVRADSGSGNYEVDIEETDTSVGNPTVYYDIIRVR